MLMATAWFLIELVGAPGIGESRSRVSVKDLGRAEPRQRVLQCLEAEAVALVSTCASTLRESASRIATR